MWLLMRELGRRDTYFHVMTVEIEPMTVALMNDYEVVVRGLASLLEGFTDELTIVELDVATPTSAVVDIVLYDTFALGDAGDDALEKVLSANHESALVFYTWNLAPRVVVEARARGVRGVLSKALSAEELVKCLQRIRRGEVVISPEPTEGSELMTGDWPGKDRGLTPREAEVVALIAQGVSNKEIAATTYLSINSIKSYIRSAYRTMGVTTRSQAVRWCLERGIGIEPMRVSVDRSRE